MTCFFSPIFLIVTALNPSSSPISIFSKSKPKGIYFVFFFFFKVGCNLEKLECNKCYSFKKDKLVSKVKVPSYPLNSYIISVWLVKIVNQMIQIHEDSTQAHHHCTSSQTLTCAGYDVGDDLSVGSTHVRVIFRLKTIYCGYLFAWN